MPSVKASSAFEIALASAALGAITALLFIARKPAEELRNDILNRTREATEKALDKARTIRNNIKEPSTEEIYEPNRQTLWRYSE